LAGRVIACIARSVGQKAVERRPLGPGQCMRSSYEMPVDGGDSGDPGPGERRQELGDAKRRQGIAPAERKKLGHRYVDARKTGLYAACPAIGGGGFDESAAGAAWRRQRQCCRIFDRNSCARSDRGLPKKSSLL